MFGDKKTAVLRETAVDFCVLLLSRRSSNRTNTCTSAALYTSVSVDSVFSVTF